MRGKAREERSPDAADRASFEIPKLPERDLGSLRERMRSYGGSAAFHSRGITNAWDHTEALALKRTTRP